MILIRNVSNVRLACSAAYSTRTKEYALRSIPGITSFSETQDAKWSLLQWLLQKATIVCEQDNFEGGERAGGRQTEEIALASLSEPADDLTPSQMRQD
jgi:hypothetical protein